MSRKHVFIKAPQRMWRLFFMQNTHDAHEKMDYTFAALFRGGIRVAVRGRIGQRHLHMTI